MTEEAMFEMLARYAEGLQTTPFEVIRLFLQVSIMLGFALGSLLCLAIDRLLLDRLFDGLGHLFHWLRSRRKEGTK